MGWKTVEIGQVASIDAQNIMPSNNQIYNYVGLENIDSGTGKIAGDIVTSGREIASSKYIFNSEHLDD